MGGEYLSHFGVFRFQGQWVLAWGPPAGQNAMQAKAETRITDQQLRSFYAALLTLSTQEQATDRIALPYLLPQVTVTRQGLLDTCQKVRAAIQQLDSGKDIPESNVYTGGSDN